MVKLMMEF